MHPLSLYTNLKRNSILKHKDNYIMYRKRSVPLEYDVLLATSIVNGLDLDKFINKNPSSKVEYSIKGVQHCIVIAPYIKKVIEDEIFTMAHKFLSNPDFEFITYVSGRIREGLASSISLCKEKKVTRR